MVYALQIVLPGTDRILNFAEMEIWSAYTPTSPAYSFCNTPCTAANCLAGSAQCSGGLSTAVCTAGNCDPTVTNGVAFGFNANTQQCTQCNANTQYANAAGVCQSCPTVCRGAPCQVLNSSVFGGVVAQSPGAYNNRNANLARDTSAATYTETLTGPNPWWQINLGSTVQVVSVQLRNRPNACGARLFNGNTACNFGIVPAGSGNDREWNQTTQGATIRVSTTPCVTGQPCPGTVCGRLTRPSTTGWDYTVTCASSIGGNYVSIQLPGTRRILQLANVAVNQDAQAPSC
jgi:hypothetical protein